MNAACGKFGMSTCKGEKLEFAILAPMAAIEADDHGPVGQQRTQIAEAASVVGKQERWQRIALGRRGDAGGGILELGNEVLVGGSKRAAVLFDSGREQR